MNIKNNYYFSSFFWSTLQKILNAVLGFISVPLLLGFYGKAEYGILAIATACNGYMHLLDLGMNTGTIKFFSQWRAEGKYELVNRVARTNITFYLIISLINATALILLGMFGEPLFSVTHEQFLQLRLCLYIIALFSVFSWGTTTFNQLLISDKQMAYTQKVSCVTTVLKTLLVFCIFWTNMTLTTYFFLLTMLLSSLFVPYSIKCKRDGLIDSFIPATYWKDFRIVIGFSLSIFALSLFQMTATQSRPILLSMFSSSGADTVSEFRIIEVVPQLIIMIGGTFSSIFLPKTSEMVTKGNHQEISRFSYKWTRLTTIVANILCFPFMLCASEVLIAYVGNEYSNLSLWLILWCITALIQIHTTPGNALVLAYGKTKMLVISTGIACVLSMGVNIMLCKYYGVGAAVIGYLIYVCYVIGLYYIYYYKKLLALSRFRMIKAFAQPTIIAVLVAMAVNLVPVTTDLFPTYMNIRMQYILICIIKTSAWLVPYLLLLTGMKLVDIKDFKR